MKKKPHKKAKKKTPRQKFLRKVMKPKKKIVPKNRPVNRPSAMAIVPYEQIQKPEVYRGKYSIVPTQLTQRQIVSIIAPTPKEIIKNRPGKGGGNWDYVPGWWIKKKLNFVFGFSYDFQILGERLDGDFITVKGRLIIRNPKTGNPIASKDDYGSAEVKRKKDTKLPLNIGNDFKAAQTDCLKRCAVQIGFCMDVYGKSEAQEEGYQVVEKMPTPPIPPKNSGKISAWECFEGAEPITEQEAEYSKKVYGKPLCREHQKTAKRK